MKNNPSKTEDIASQRIITPLAPKRVPSVAPGLEGLAAMATDDGEAAPEITASYAMATVGMDPAAAIAWAKTIPDEALRHKTLLTMAQNRAAGNDTEALELFKAAGLSDREIHEAGLLPAIVDRRIPSAQASGTITRFAMVRPD
jgi:hypothetical protein